MNMNNVISSSGKLKFPILELNRKQMINMRKQLSKAESICPRKSLQSTLLTEGVWGMKWCCDQASLHGRSASASAQGMATALTAT